MNENDNFNTVWYNRIIESNSKNIYLLMRLDTCQDASKNIVGYENVCLHRKRCGTSDLKSISFFFFSPETGLCCQSECTLCYVISRS